MGDIIRVYKWNLLSIGLIISNFILYIMKILSVKIFYLLQN